MSEIQNTKKEKRVFIFFTDLDATFDKRGPKNMMNFCETMKDISKKEDVDVVFFPISARSGQYVISTLNQVKDSFEEYKKDGLNFHVQYGSAEMGGRIVDCERSSKMKLIVDKKTQDVANEIAEYIKIAPFKHKIELETDYNVAFLIHVKKEYQDQCQEIQRELEKGIKKILPNDKIWMDISNFIIEVKSATFCKATAVEWYIKKLEKEGRELAGVVYCGDGENDKEAIEHTLSLNKRGYKANAILPSNAQEILKSINIDGHKPILTTKYGMQGVVEGLQILEKKHELLKSPKGGKSHHQGSVKRRLESFGLAKFIKIPTKMSPTPKEL